MHFAQSIPRAFFYLWLIIIIFLPNVIGYICEKRFPSLGLSIHLVKLGPCCSHPARAIIAT
jgi:hypothetical protein